LGESLLFKYFFFLVCEKVIDFLAYLDRYGFIAQQSDLHLMTLGNAMMLQVDESGGGHLDRVEDGHHFQNAVIKRWSHETIVIFAASPEIRASHETAKNLRNFTILNWQKCSRF